MINNISRRKLLLAGSASILLLPIASQAQANTKLHEVEIRGFKYFPETVEVRPGDTIRWTNRDAAPHDATGGNWNTEIMTRNQSAKIIVRADMDLNYICSIHPQMRASLKIMAA